MTDEAFQGFAGDSHFFAASKLGLEADFCTFEMGLIDWSIDLRACQESIALKRGTDGAIV
jgi:hypothetical protein